MKPIIGLTSQYSELIHKKRFDVKASYVSSITKAGAIPLVIPIIDNHEDIGRYFDIIDGIVFTGGSDISPLYFGENPLEYTSQICHERDRMEFKLLETAMERSIPVLGICRGLQIINTVYGGTLYQDIPKQVPNSHGHFSFETMKDGYHEVDIMKDGFLYEIFNKDQIVVNSLHHQSIKELGRNLKTIARSKDGIIEGIESTDNKKIYGVQFHPEDLVDKYQDFLKIFEFFIGKL